MTRLLLAAAPALAAAALLASPAALAADPTGSWRPAGSTSLEHNGHTATLLADGTVLVAGGFFDGTGVPTWSAELYCLVTSAICTASDVGKFRALANMANARAGHTATLLADGTVLVAGGFFDATGTPTPSVEVYCAAVAGPQCTLPSDVGTFKVVSAMSTPRADHTATLLSNNTVLVAGGLTDAVNPPTNTSEIFCASVGGPCTAADGTFQPSGNMATSRDSHTATLLADGTVLVAGGQIDASGTPTNTAEIYCAAIAGSLCTSPSDVSTFKVTSSMFSARAVHTASLLEDGRVLVAGGYDLTGAPTASADVYCVAVVAGSCSASDVGTFKPVGDLVTGRANQTSTLLADGRVLAAGGVPDATSALATSELFDPSIAAFATGAVMASPRSDHASIRLPDGRVLVMGGRNAQPGTVLSSTELYNGPPPP